MSHGPGEADDDHEDSGYELQPAQVTWDFAGAAGDYPGLRHLFWAYLHWPAMEDSPDWRGPVRDFKAEDPEAVPEVLQDLDALIAAKLGEEGLERVLTELGCGTYRDGGRGSWSAWLGRLRNELANWGRSRVTTPRHKCGALLHRVQ